MEKILLDVSAYQPVIHYKQVAESGVGGVILRCGVTLWGKQTCTADMLFHEHYRGFKEAGVPLGVYYYSAADSIASAEAEADFVIRLLRGKQLELPVYYDIECEPRMGKLTKAELTAIAKAFCDKLERAGYFVGIYANTNYWLTKLDHAALSKRYTTWLADYRGKRANRTLHRDIWQYTSTGSVAGIEGRVDMNECYRDFEPIIRAAGLNGFRRKKETYTVLPGDSFWRIAFEQLGDGGKMGELAAFNGMTVNSVIHPGDVLLLPPQK